MGVADRIHDRVLYYLKIWSAWHKVEGWPELGYPPRVLIFVTGGETQRFDDWAESEEDKARTSQAEVMEALVSDLAVAHPAQACAVEHFALGLPWRFPRANAEALYLLALDWLTIGINKRGLP